MNKISLLSAEVAEKISAGEVIERPASVVKELVENSLDAGAGHIRIDFSEWGTKLIKVSDDGSGMSPDDTVMSVKRHSTSKLKVAADLENISTFGFRGEALSAISAVSRVNIITRTSDNQSAVAVKFEAGKVTQREETSRNCGTTIEIADLFFNTPARHKFMKTRQTERNHIISCFEELALANPETGFELHDENKCLYNLASVSKALERVSDIFGSDITEYFSPVKVSHIFVKITGFITKPLYRQNARSKNYIFINRRPVLSRILNFAITDAYRPYLPQGNFPVCVLFLDINPDLVDVNVHPAKREIRLSKEREIFSLLKETVLTTIQRSIVPELMNVKSDSFDIRPKDMPADPTDLRQKIAVEKSIYKYMDNNKNLNTEKIPSGNPAADHSEVVNTEKGTSSRVATETWENTLMDMPMDLADVRPIGQFNKLYIIAEWGDNLIILDQHAAQERVLFESFIKGLNSGSFESQELLVPYIFEMQQSEAEVFGKYLPELKKARIEVEAFGDKGYLLRSLPIIFRKMEDFKSFISQIIEQLIFFEESKEADINSTPQILEKIIKAACIGAVKANQELSLEEIKKLILDLSECSNPYSCPHGRPTFIKINSKELAKRFDRT